jgi:hypothetical protein
VLIRHFKDLVPYLGKRDVDLIPEENSWFASKIVGEKKQSQEYLVLFQGYFIPEWIDANQIFDAELLADWRSLSAKAKRALQLEYEQTFNDTMEQFDRLNERYMTEPIEVERVIASKGTGRNVTYQVAQPGAGEDDYQWVSESRVTNRELLREFTERALLNAQSKGKKEKKEKKTKNPPKPKPIATRKSNRLNPTAGGDVERNPKTVSFVDGSAVGPKCPNCGQEHLRKGVMTHCYHAPTSFANVGAYSRRGAFESTAVEDSSSDEDVLE